MTDTGRRWSLTVRPDRPIAWLARDVRAGGTIASDTLIGCPEGVCLLAAADMPTGTPITVDPGTGRAVPHNGPRPSVCTYCWFHDCTRCTGWAGNNGMHGLERCPCDHDAAADPWEA